MIIETKRKLLNKILDESQRSINRQIEKEGINETIIEKQAQINKRRHQNNLTDQNQKVYKNYVQ